MYIPRHLLSSAYAHLKAHAHSTNPSILLLCALDTDSLCAARILTHLLKQDYIPHKIHPVAGYQELENVNKTLIRGNEELRFVICLGLGGLIDIAAFLDLSGEGEEGEGVRRVECWLVDGRRPWNLQNVFGGGGGGGGKEVEEKGANGKVKGGRYGVGEGVNGVKCFDDGDIEEELEGEGVAYRALVDMPEIDEDSDDSDDDEEEEGEEIEEIQNDGGSEDEDEGGGVRVQLSVGSGEGVASGRKRKSSEQPGGSSDSEGESDREISRVRRRRRTGSNLVCRLPLN